MTKLTVLCTAAMLASTAALPSIAQAAGCAQYDPNCATYPMPSNDTSGSPRDARAEANRPDAASHQRRHHMRSASRASRTAQREAMNNGDYSNGTYGPGEQRPGFWPGEVAGAAIGTAGDIAVGAADTAGAIATAPFRAADSYGSYNNGDNGWNNNAWNNSGWNNSGWNNNNGWYQQSYEERNGFVCTPGTYFKGADGLRHPCQ